MIEPLYENVDVDIRSSRELTTLEAAVRSKVHVLHHGSIGRKFHLRFALRRVTRNPAVAVRSLTRLIRQLPPAAQRAWKAADSREFDIGFSSGAGATGEWVLPEDIALSLAKLGAQIRITIYPE